MVAAARLDTSACKRYLSTRYAAYECCLARGYEGELQMRSIDGTFQDIS